jgi:Arc/MetJ family transcription regulator
VELALRRLAGEPMNRDEALAMEGTGWSGDLGAMREADATAWPTDATAGS